MKKIIFLTIISLIVFTPICTAQDETNFATAEAYANGIEVGAYAEAYANNVEAETYTETYTSDGTEDVVYSDTLNEISKNAEINSYGIYYQQTSQNQTNPPQARSIASNDTEQINSTKKEPTDTDEITVKVDTISKLADDTIKQIDIIEKQNAKTLSLFLVVLVAIILILILTIANLIVQLKIKNKLLQNI